MKKVYLVIIGGIILIAVILGSVCMNDSLKRFIKNDTDFKVYSKDVSFNGTLTLTNNSTDLRWKDIKGADYYELVLCEGDRCIAFTYSENNSLGNCAWEFIEPGEYEFKDNFKYSIYIYALKDEYDVISYDDNTSIKSIEKEFNVSGGLDGNIKDKAIIEFNNVKIRDDRKENIQKSVIILVVFTIIIIVGVYLLRNKKKSMIIVISSYIIILIISIIQIYRYQYIGVSNVRIDYESHCIFENVRYEEITYDKNNENTIFCQFYLDKNNAYITDKKMEVVDNRAYLEFNTGYKTSLRDEETLVTLYVTLPKGVNELYIANDLIWKNGEDVCNYERYLYSLANSIKKDNYNTLWNEIGMNKELEISDFVYDENNHTLKFVSEENVVFEDIFKDVLNSYSCVIFTLIDDVNEITWEYKKDNDKINYIVTEDSLSDLLGKPLDEYTLYHLLYNICHMYYIEKEDLYHFDEQYYTYRVNKFQKRCKLSEVKKYWGHLLEEEKRDFDDINANFDVNLDIDYDSAVIDETGKTLTMSFINNYIGEYDYKKMTKCMYEAHAIVLFALIEDLECVKYMDLSDDDESVEYARYEFTRSELEKTSGVKFAEYNEDVTALLELIHAYFYFGQM